MLVKNMHTRVAPFRMDLEKSRVAVETTVLWASPAKLSAKLPDWIPISSIQVTSKSQG